MFGDSEAFGISLCFALLSFAEEPAQGPQQLCFAFARAEVAKETGGQPGEPQI
jgi:hypothetical protein